MRFFLALLLLTAGAGTAAAYPHFQLSSGTLQCAQCHIAPAGGGLLTPWGADEAGDTLATTGGDGHFLHGAVTLPESLALGGDFRLAALANDTGSTSGTELAWFPMQADLGAHVGNEFSLTVVAGARGAVRSGAPNSPQSDPPVGNATSPSLRSYVIAREVYGMWRSEGGAYARAGRFAAPYGLRLADHTAYVRRYLGYNLMEETLGAGGGYVAEGWEVHATAFVFDPLQGAARHEVGGAVMAELQPAASAALGLSARAGKTAEDLRAQAGVHAKLWLDAAHLLVQGELDGVHQAFDAGGARNQLAAYVGPVVVPAKGVYAGVAYEAFAEDLAVHGVLRQAADIWISVLPRAHWEVMLSGRGQRIGPNEHAAVGLLQVHYFL